MKTFSILAVVLGLLALPACTSRTTTTSTTTTESRTIAAPVGGVSTTTVY